MVRQRDLKKRAGAAQRCQPESARAARLALLVALVPLATSRVASADDLLRATARQLGTAGAGVAIAEDPGVIASNPSAIAGMRDAAAVVGASLGMVRETFAGEASPEQFFFLSRGSFALPLGESLTLGLSAVPWDVRRADYATAELARVGYDAGVSLSYLLPSEWLPGRARIGAMYRLRFDDETRVADGQEARGFGVQPLSGTIGLQYSPVDELNFGLALDSGGPLTRTSDGYLNGNRADVTSTFAAPWAARAGLAFDLDRFGLRFDYTLELTQFDDEIRFTAPGASSVAYGQERALTHGVLVGFEYRLAVGRETLPLRIGYALSSGRDNTSYPSAFLRQFAPSSALTLGAGYRTRRLEGALGFAYRESRATLEAAPRGPGCDACSPGGSYGFSELMLALDLSYRFGR